VKESTLAPPAGEARLRRSAKLCVFVPVVTTTLFTLPSSMPPPRARRIGYVPVGTSEIV
jgi:hypothetical protein